MKTTVIEHVYYLHYLYEHYNQISVFIAILPNYYLNFFTIQLENNY